MQSLFHEIHFWIGKHSTPDKYGTAAYRTVDLYRHVSHNNIIIVPSMTLNVPHDMTMPLSHYILTWFVPDHDRSRTSERLLGSILKCIVCIGFTWSSV